MPRFFYLYISSTPQPLNPSTPQPLNPSTPQTFMSILPITIGFI